MFIGQMDLIISATVRCDEKSVVSEAKMPLYTILIAFTLCLRVATQVMRSHVDVKHTVMLTLNTPLCYPHKSTV